MPPASSKGGGPIRYLEYRDGSFSKASGHVLGERPVCIFINGRELVTVLCTPEDLEDLAVGFAFSEGIIDGMADVEAMSVSAGLTCVDLWLRDRDIEPPARRIITSGCGGGVTFDDTDALEARHAPLDPGPTVAASRLSHLMREVLRTAEQSGAARGVHTSAIADGEALVLVAHDVGRHNTIDRLAGRALRQGIDIEGAVLLTSGRISSEMLSKAARMRTPVVVSRTSPTDLAVDLARAWDITLIGYARGAGFRVYASPERVAGIS